MGSQRMYVRSLTLKRGKGAFQGFYSCRHTQTYSHGYIATLWVCEQTAASLLHVTNAFGVARCLTQFRASASICSLPLSLLHAQTWEFGLLVRFSESCLPCMLSSIYPVYLLRRRVRLSSCLSHYSFQLSVSLHFPLSLFRTPFIPEATRAPLLLCVFFPCEPMMRGNGSWWIFRGTFFDDHQVPYDQLHIISSPFFSWSNFLVPSWTLCHII